MTEKLQALYKAQIEALAAIVNVRTPDKLYNLEAIPRDPVMVQVQKIRTALDVFMTASKLAQPSDHTGDSTEKVHAAPCSSTWCSMPSWCYTNGASALNGKCKKARPCGATGQPAQK